MLLSDGAPVVDVVKVLATELVEGVEVVEFVRTDVAVVMVGLVESVEMGDPVSGSRVELWLVNAAVVNSVVVDAAMQGTLTVSQ